MLSAFRKGGELCGGGKQVIFFCFFQFFLASIYSQWKQRKQSFLGEMVISNVPSEHIFAFKNGGLHFKTKNYLLLISNMKNYFKINIYILKP